MKNIFLRERTARDIDGQVAKVLRGLGNPEPPLDLNLVRELLRLDRQYYTSTSDGVLREMTSRLKVAGKQVLTRPSLLGEAIKKWDLRALFLPDRKRILIDSTLPKPKQRWSEAHEVGHGIIPWHQDTMMGDNKQTLTPTCHEKIENEANYAAGQLLFLQEKFVMEARDFSPGIDAIKQLKSKYGNTITTTLWRYVEQSEDILVGGISFHPHRLPPEFDPQTPFRYFVRSRKFSEHFSEVSQIEIFKEIQNYCANKKGGPLGEAEVILSDNAARRHIFHFDTFFNQYEALTLGVYRRQSALVIPLGR